MCSRRFFSRDSKLSIRYVEYIATLIRANLPCPPLRQGRDLPALPKGQAQGRGFDARGPPHWPRHRVFVAFVHTYIELVNRSSGHLVMKQITRFFGVSIEALYLFYIFMFGDRQPPGTAFFSGSVTDHKEGTFREMLHATSPSMDDWITHQRPTRRFLPSQHVILRDM